MSLPPPVERRRPTRRDHELFEDLQRSSSTRMKESSRTWRNAFAMLAAGLGALLGLVGTQLDAATPWCARLVLTLTLGAGVALVGIACWKTFNVDGGRRPVKLSLAQIVDEYNSVDQYFVEQAGAAQENLVFARKLATIGAVLGFVGLLTTLWINGPSPSDGITPAPTSPITTSSP